MEDKNKIIEFLESKSKLFDLIKTGENNTIWGGMLLIALLAIADSYFKNKEK